MKAQLFKLFVAGSLLLLSVAGNAQTAQDTPDSGATVANAEPDCAQLLSMLEGGASAEAVVRATMATGMSLSAATVYAMECGGESHRIALAVAGIKLAGTLMQAQLVADAVRATAGDDPNDANDANDANLANAVREVMIEITEGWSQPDVYVDEYTPTGADVSPSS